MVYYMAYVPRLDTTGMANNFHWYSNDNPYEATGYGMPNCTAYAWHGVDFGK